VFLQACSIVIVTETYGIEQEKTPYKLYGEKMFVLNYLLLYE